MSALHCMNFTLNSANPLSSSDTVKSAVLLPTSLCILCTKEYMIIYVELDKSIAEFRSSEADKPIVDFTIHQEKK